MRDIRKIVEKVLDRIHDRRYANTMEKMIDNNIELGRMETALRMEWVKLAYEQTGDFDTAFNSLMVLHKGDKI